MTLIQLYFYFLMLVLMYSSPISFLVLFFGWRKKYLAKSFLGLLAVNLLIAGVAVGGFQLSQQRNAASYQAGLDDIEAYVGDPAQLSVVLGRFVGTEPHGDYDYIYYQFPALDSSDRVLEMVVSPPKVNGAGYIRHASQFKPAIEDARLIVWPRHIGMNPSLLPEAFFAEHVPGENAHSFGEHTLIAGLRPRDSVIVYPSEAGAVKWLWRRAVLGL
tara:strand:- start:814 stop:1461 length:648 start_codon:yes stop_codon:yes gene_type:complete